MRYRSFIGIGNRVGWRHLTAAVPNPFVTAPQGASFREVWFETALGRISGEIRLECAFFRGRRSRGKARREEG